MTEPEIIAVALELQDKLAKVMTVFDQHLQAEAVTKPHGREVNEPLNRDMGDIMVRSARLYDNIQELKRKLA